KPWTWLHAIKDYTDMAAHLETVPGARAVVNFSPVLIEQLQDYPRRIRGRLDGDEAIGDFVLDALAGRFPEQNAALTAQLLRVNEQRMMPRFRPYAELFDRAAAALNGDRALSDEAFHDLLVWYVLVWLGESLRGSDLIEAMVAQGRHFQFDDRRKLLAHVADVMDAILPRYRELARSGAVELSVTPYAHPILPLLLDYESAREAMPGVQLPENIDSDGKARCNWHLDEARCAFLEVFGSEPPGCWPSEGAVSEATLRVLARHHFRWAASGSAVLATSLGDTSESPPGPAHLHAWQLDDGPSPACFFRDDGLSDLIGFEYSRWQADDAVADFLGHLERLRSDALTAGNTAPVLSIIMDGENAWEYFDHNGWDFLQGLYAALAEHPGLRLATFSDVVERCEPRMLPRLRAGSWVHGNFSTWIGEPAKNLAWSLIADAGREVEHSPRSKDPAVLRQLAICEASDWMWWLGESVTLQDAPAFDALFRHQLAELYRMIGSTPPATLDEPLCRHATGSGPSDDIVGAMRRSTG
ncbi:MAG: glycoside hydrolase family 57 protein, partial [Xanthomonadales bacterium]|nr:glycoside hydrolase family 57 protein [Xanthomonadales bacterium]